MTPVSSEDPARPVLPPAGSADSGQAEPPPRLAARNAGVPASPPSAGTPAQSSGTRFTRPGSVPDPSSPPRAFVPGEVSGGTREEGSGAVLRPGTGAPPALDPPRAVPDEQAPSGPAARGGSTAQDARDAWKAAQSALNAEKRRRRGRYRPKGAAPGYGPGMGRRMPPGGAA